MVFRRGYASGVGREGGKEQEHPKEGVGLDTSFWSFAPDVLTNLDAGVLATGSANNHGAKVQDGGWELIRVFGRDVLRDVAGEVRHIHPFCWVKRGLRLMDHDCGNIGHRRV